MANWVKIGNISINILDVDGISEKAFIDTFKPHYKRIGNGSDKVMKSDYKELKKHFTKKRIKKD